MLVHSEQRTQKNKILTHRKQNKQLKHFTVQQDTWDSTIEHKGMVLQYACHISATVRKKNMHGSQISLATDI